MTQAHRCGVARLGKPWYVKKELLPLGSLKDSMDAVIFDVQ